MIQYSVVQYTVQYSTQYSTHYSTQYSTQYNRLVKCRYFYKIRPHASSSGHDRILAEGLSRKLFYI
jgi:hypothetical protein